MPTDEQLFEGWRASHVLQGAENGYKDPSNEEYVSLEEKKLGTIKYDPVKGTLKAKLGEK